MTNEVLDPPGFDKKAVSVVVNPHVSGSIPGCWNATACASKALQAPTQELDLS